MSDRLPSHEPDVDAILALLRRWIAGRLPAEPRAWADAAIDELATAPTDRRLYRVYGEAALRCGTADLAASAAELDEAESIRPRWRPVDWSVDQLVRTAMLLATATAGEDARSEFGHRLDTLVRTADVRELVTLQRGLPLYPGADRHAARAALGVRSNIRPVFEAVAHHSPYPAESFEEGAWNQMVLKALFVESALDPIVGLEERANPRLSAMLRGYAGERRAASRPVSPELWRCVGAAPDEGAIDDLRRLLAEGTDAERRAAVLALRAIDDPEAAALRRSAAELDAGADEGRYGWSDLVP